MKDKKTLNSDVIGYINNSVKDVLEKNIISDETTVIQTNLNRIKSNYENLNNDIQYFHLIQGLTRLQDEEKGITWHIKESRDNSVIIRDARNANINQESLQQNNISFKIQLVNLTRAAELLIKTSELAHEQKQKIIKELRQNLFDNFEKFNRKSNAELNNQLVEMTDNIGGIIAKNCEISRKDSITRLNKAKEFTSFDDRHYTITTIHEVNGQIFSEIDIPLTKLTDLQKQEFENLDSALWFQALPVWEQSIIKTQKPKIIDGEHNCPTQLRELPLLKNGYQKFIQKYEQDENGIFKVKHLDSHFHTGTHYVSVDKSVASIERERESERLTKMVKDQHIQYASEGIQIIGLLSPLPGLNEEKVNVETLDRVFEQNYNNLPANAGRIFIGNNIKGIEHILSNLVEIIKPEETLELELPIDIDKIKQLKLYIKEGKLQASDQKTLSSYLSDLDLNEKEKKILESAVKIRKLINDKNLGIDSENRNLSLVTEFQNLTNLIKQLPEAVKPKLHLEKISESNLAQETNSLLEIPQDNLKSENVQTQSKLLVEGGQLFKELDKVNEALKELGKKVEDSNSLTPDYKNYLVKFHKHQKEFFDFDIPISKLIEFRTNNLTGIIDKNTKMFEEFFNIERKYFHLYEKKNNLERKIQEAEREFELIDTESGITFNDISSLNSSMSSISSGVLSLNSSTSSISNPDISTTEERIQGVITELDQIIISKEGLEDIQNIQEEENIIVKISKYKERLSQALAKKRYLQDQNELLLHPENNTIDLTTEIIIKEDFPQGVGLNTIDEIIAQDYKMLSELIRQYNQEVDTQKSRPSIFHSKMVIPEICVECKSGKDRTGIVELNILANYIEREVSISHEKVLQEIAAVSNAVFEPGLGQGGTAGAFGIKKEAGSVVPKSWSKEVINNIILATANNNNLKSSGLLSNIFNFIKKVINTVFTKNNSTQATSLVEVLPKHTAYIQEQRQNQSPELNNESTQTTDNSKNNVIIDSLKSEIDADENQDLGNSSISIQTDDIVDPILIDSNIKDNQQKNIKKDKESNIQNRQDKVDDYNNAKISKNEQIRDATMTIKYAALLLLGMSIFMSGGMASISLLLVVAATIYIAREDQNNAENRISSIEERIDAKEKFINKEKEKQLSSQQSLFSPLNSQQEEKEEQVTLPLSSPDTPTNNVNNNIQAR